MDRETIFLVAFFKFHDWGSDYGFKRIHLQHVFKTEKEARENLYFCDEAGWYEGALIEERAFGPGHLFRGKRIWLIQSEDGHIKEIEPPHWFSGIVNLIG